MVESVGGNGKQHWLTPERIDAWLATPATGKVMKLADGLGLFLVRLPSGGTTWQVRYKLDGRPKTYSIGPHATLDEARAERTRIAELIRVKPGSAESVVDPVAARRVQKAREEAACGELFKDVAYAWLEKEKPGWSEVHYLKSKKAIERDVLDPKRSNLGTLPIARITPRDVSKVVERIQKRGVRDTAMKILQHVRSIFRYSQALGMRNDNPADPAAEVLHRPGIVKHRPALLSFPELGKVLRDAEAANTTPAVRLAHRLIAFTAVRISNAVAAKWSDFDLDASLATWTIPRSEMKVRDRSHDHKVVLPEQIAHELRRWRAAQRRTTPFVFPGHSGRKHLSRESVEKMMRVTLALSGKHSAHGWRASFSTLCKEDEAADFDNQVVDLTLDHIHDTAVARAYDRGQRLQQRVALMQWWGDQLDKAEHGADVVRLERKPHLSAVPAVDA
jgi:integrase